MFRPNGISIIQKILGDFNKMIDNLCKGVENLKTLIRKKT